MKGYKGFEKGLICRGKQYAENTVFEEDSAEICESGMHFCKNPFDVLDYYGFVNDDGELNEFCEVEALDDVKTDDDKKFCTKKLKIGAKIGITGLIKAFVGFTLENVKSEKVETNTGYRSAATNTGDQSAATNTGDRSAATNTGYQSAATNTGNRSAATNTGDRSAATNTGYQSAATNTGYQSAATNTGYQSTATNTGYQSAATNTGNRSAATNTGNRSAATVSGSESFAIATGIESKANNMKELKHIDGWECTLGFTSLGTSPELLRLSLGAATVVGNKITPKMLLEETDFQDIWWVGDKADGGFVAVRLMNALSTGGLSLKTTKKGKGQISVTLTGHFSIEEQDTVPMEFYSASGESSGEA